MRMPRIKVDIDELINKLEEIKQDDYATVEIEIFEDEDEMDKELLLFAVSFDEDEPIGYGVIAEALEDIM